MKSGHFTFEHISCYSFHFFFILIDSTIESLYRSNKIEDYSVLHLPVWVDLWQHIQIHQVEDIWTLNQCSSPQCQSDLLTVRQSKYSLDSFILFYYVFFRYIFYYVLCSLKYLVATETPQDRVLAHWFKLKPYVCTSIIVLYSWAFYSFEIT